MILLLGYVVYAVLFLLIVVLNGATGGALLGWAELYLSLIRPNWPFGEFIFFAGLEVVLYFLVLVPVHIFVARHLEPRNRDDYPWLRRLGEALYCQGQAWPRLILVPFAITLVVALVPVMFGWFHPAWWWFCCLGLVGLWGNHLMGIPGNPQLRWAGLELDSALSGPSPLSDSQPRSDPSEPGRESIQEFLERLEQRSAYDGQICYRVLPDSADPDPALCGLAPRRARYCDSDEAKSLSANPILAGALMRLGIEGPSRLYVHQGRALRLAQSQPPPPRRRPHLLLATPVGSGRSMVCALIALERVLEDHRSVLLVYPDEWIGRRHASRLRGVLSTSEWEWALSIEELWDADEARTLDGPHIPDLLFTTVEILNRVVLPARDDWAAFLHSLDLIIASDLEEYSGVFGSNCALLFRRLRRLCHHYGSDPQVLAACPPRADAVHFMENLFGVDMAEDDVITLDGKERSPKGVMLWDPYLGHAAKGNAHATGGQDHLAGACQLLAEMYRGGFRPLMLTKGVPLTTGDMTDLQQDALAQLREDDPRPRGTAVIHHVRDLAAGHSPGGSSAGCVGDYDSAILTDFPGPWSATRYELEHLAREGDGLICVATPMTPLAQYLAHRPKEYLTSQLDERDMAISLTNGRILRRHLLWALQEMSLTDVEVRTYFGLEARGKMERLVGEGLVREEAFQDVDDDKVVWRKLYSVEEESLIERRSTLRLVDWTGYRVLADDQGGVEVGLIEEGRVPEVAYEGAILHLRNERYRVVAVADGVVQVCGERSWRHTEKVSEFSIQAVGNQPLARDDEASQPLPDKGQDTEEDRPKLMPDGTRVYNQWLVPGGEAIGLRLSRVRVNEHIVGCREYDRYHVDAGALRDLSPQERPPFETWAVVMTLPQDTSEAVLHTLAHLVRSLLPLFLANSPQDVCVVHCPTFANAVGMPTLVIFDNIEGGLGAAQLLIRRIEELLAKAYDLLVSCSCAEGCPACIQIINCHAPEGNLGLEKSGTLRLLERILGLSERRTGDEVSSKVTAWTVD